MHGCDLFYFQSTEEEEEAHCKFLLQVLVKSDDVMRARHDIGQTIKAKDGACR